MRWITAAALALTATTAHAQGGPQCVHTEVLIEHLRKEYREAPIWFGQTDGGMFVLFASPDGATWTLALNRGPMTCMLASGAGSSLVEPKAKGGGA